MGQELQNTLGNVTISSPTAASLGKFGDIPVSYHTGVPNVDIPLYTVKAGPLNLPISMSYHASGLKVMEPAGWVGAGWALNAGGVITRTVVGQPDESGANSGNQVDGHYSQSGYNSYLYTAGVQDWQGFAAGRKDGEPDMYFFNVGGYSGKFYFRDDRTPILVPQQDLKITPVFTGGRSFDYFTIVTPDGTQYFFGNAPGVTGTAPVEYTNCYSAKNGAVGFPPVSSWFLSKVVSADNQFTINLSYQAESYGYFTIAMFPVDGWKTGTDGQGYDLVKNLIQGVRLSQITFPNGTVALVPGAVRTDLSDNVQSLTDGANTSAVRLGAIQIADSNGIYCKKFNFSYDYFSGDNTALPNSLTWGTSISSDQQRLKLTSIQEVSCDGSIQVPPYKFTYASGVVPRRLSFGVDHWGYYNGQTGNTGLIPTYTVNGAAFSGANRDASWPEMLDGALTRIDYPTGGYDIMNFESNSTYVTVTTPVTRYLAQFAFHVFGQSATSGSNTFTSDGNDITITYTTNCNFGGPLHIINSSGQTVYSVIFSNTPNYNNNTPVTTSNTVDKSLFPPGTYTITASLSAGPNDDITGGVSINVTQPDVESETVLKTLGGLRIESLSKSDGITSKVQQTNYTYSGGVLYSQPSYAQMIRNDLIANVGYWNPSTGFGSSITNGCPTSGSYYKSPGSIRPMASMDGSIMGYLTVSVSQPGNGRTDYYYSTPSGGYELLSNIQSFNSVVQNCSSDIPNYPSAPLPYDPYRGLLTSENHFDESGKQLKSILYLTTFNQSPTLSTPGFSVASVDFGSGSQLLGTFYTLNTARKVSVQTLEDNFGAGSSSVRKSTMTYFSSPFHTQATRTVTSTSVGDSLATNTSYVSDIRLPTCDAISDCSAEYNSACSACLATYNSARTSCAGSGSCLTTAYLNYQQCNTNARTSYVSCRNTNIASFNSCHLSAESGADNGLKSVLVLQDDNVNTPLEVSKWRNAGLTQSSYTTYSPSVIPTGFAYPAKTQLINVAAVSTALTPAAVAGSSIGKDSRYQDESSYQFNAGNLQSANSRSGVATSYIWDYSNVEPVAKVVNSGVGEIAYSSFETSSSGGWSVSGVTVDASSAVTGRRSCSIGSGSISFAGLNSTHSYFVTYWMQGGSHTSVTVGGTVSGYPKIGKTVVINNTAWTLFVHKVTGQSSVTVTGSGRIDELRLYPVAAQMTTYTYDPLVGMTSQTDAGSRVTYYEYDGLSRLKRIRDQDFNILKSLDYQYQAQAGCGSGCAVVAMQTLLGSNTIGYPVGVFSVHGNLLGNAAGPDDYVSKWNSDTADAAIGTLAKSSDSLHFNLTLNAGKTAPAGVTGSRYFQYDVAWSNIDGIRAGNGEYVDFGDGIGMHIPQTASDTPTVMPPNTTKFGFFDQADQGWWFIHSYPSLPDTAVKTLTFYHSDGNEDPGLDNGNSPATGLTTLTNFRGNIPQHAEHFGTSCLQHASASSVANIANWNSISSIKQFWVHNGDRLHPYLNVGYAQDFMKNNRGLQLINMTNPSYYESGSRDSTFKLSRLKTDWNTYFTQLQQLAISDEQWNREDLSALTHLTLFFLIAGNQKHSDDETSNPIVPIPATACDSILIQIAAGSGQVNTYGQVVIYGFQPQFRTGASDAAFALLKSKHWDIYYNGELQ